MRLLQWKFALPLIGAALAITAGRMVADWSTPAGPPATPVEAGFEMFAHERYSQAELKFDQARTLDPGDGEAYHGLALVALARHGDIVRAEALFREAIARPGTSPVAYANFGRFLIAEERYEDAIPVLEAGLVKNHEFPPLRARLAIALHAAGRAEAACRMARSLGDDVPDAEEALVEMIREAPDCVTR